MNDRCTNVFAEPYLRDRHVVCKHTLNNQLIKGADIGDVSGVDDVRSRVEIRDDVVCIQCKSIGSRDDSERSRPSRIRLDHETIEPVLPENYRGEELPIQSYESGITFDGDHVISGASDDKVASRSA